MNYYDHNLYECTFLGSTKGTHCLNLMKYHGASIWEYLLLAVSMNNDPIHRKYMITLGFHSYVKVTANFDTSSVFSHGWEIIQHNNLVKSWLPNNLMSWLIVGLVQCITIHTSALFMGNPSWWPKLSISQIMR